MMRHCVSTHLTIAPTSTSLTYSWEFLDQVPGRTADVKAVRQLSDAHPERAIGYLLHQSAHRTVD